MSRECNYLQSACRSSRSTPTHALPCLPFPRQVTHVKTVAATVVECDLRGNVLTTLGNSITEIRTVRTLKLSDNRFTELPRSLTAMPRLQVTVKSPVSKSNARDIE